MRRDSSLPGGPGGPRDRLARARVGRRCPRRPAGRRADARRGELRLPAAFRPGGQDLARDRVHRLHQRGADPLPLVYLRVWSNGVLGCATHSITVSNLQGGSVTDERSACTELEVTLDAPLGPGERTTIAFDLHIRLPDEDDRFGFHRGLALAGTALPTLAVNDDRGWHRAPFENLGESFYSVVSDYEVTFVTPRGLDTAATGHGDRARRDRAGPHAHDVRGDRRCATSRGRPAAAHGRAHRGVASTWSSGTSRAPSSARPPARWRVDAADRDRYARRRVRRLPLPRGRRRAGGARELRRHGVPDDRVLGASPHHDGPRAGAPMVLRHRRQRPVPTSRGSTSRSRRGRCGCRSILAHGCRGISWPSDGAALTNDMAYWSTHRSEYGLVY